MMETIVKLKILGFTEEHLNKFREMTKEVPYTVEAVLVRIYEIALKRGTAHVLKYDSASQLFKESHLLDLAEQFR